MSQDEASKIIFQQAQKIEQPGKQVTMLETRIEELYKFWGIETEHKDAEIRRRDDLIEQISDREEQRYRRRGT